MSPALPLPALATLLAGCATPPGPPPAPAEVPVERGCPGEPLVRGGPPEPLPAGVVVHRRSVTGARVEGPAELAGAALAAAAARHAGLTDPRQALHHAPGYPAFAAVECVDGIRVLGAAATGSGSLEVVLYAVPPLPPLLPVDAAWRIARGPDGPEACAEPSLAIVDAPRSPAAVYACRDGDRWRLVDAATGAPRGLRTTPLFPDLAP